MLEASIIDHNDMKLDRPIIPISYAELEDFEVQGDGCCPFQASRRLSKLVSLVSLMTSHPNSEE